MSAALFEVLTVHCFTCEHTEQGTDTAVLHAAMERRYRSEHAELIEHLVQHGCHPRNCEACRPRPHRRRA